MANFNVASIGVVAFLISLLFFSPILMSVSLFIIAMAFSTREDGSFTIIPFIVVITIISSIYIFGVIITAPDAKIPLGIECQELQHGAIMFHLDIDIQCRSECSEVITSSHYTSITCQNGQFVCECFKR